jgi:hypothetical protein
MYQKRKKKKRKERKKEKTQKKRKRDSFSSHLSQSGLLSNTQVTQKLDSFEMVQQNTTKCV